MSYCNSCEAAQVENVGFAVLDERDILFGYVCCPSRIEGLCLILYRRIVPLGRKRMTTRHSDLSV